MRTVQLEAREETYSFARLIAVPISELNICQKVDQDALEMRVQSKGRGALSTHSLLAETMHARGDQWESNKQGKLRELDICCIFECLSPAHTQIISRAEPLQVCWMTTKLCYSDEATRKNRIKRYDTYIN